MLLSAVPVPSVAGLVVVGLLFALCRVLRHLERRGIIKRARQSDMAAIARAFEGRSPLSASLGRRSTSEEQAAVPPD